MIPLYHSYLDKETFFSIYGPLLETMDGSEDIVYVDYFFEFTPLDNRTLVFINDEVQEDFRFYAEDMKLIPPLVEVCEGESRKDKEKRQIKKVKTELSLDAKAELKLKKVQQTVDKLCQQLSDETDTAARARINEKIVRLNTLLAGSVSV